MSSPLLRENITQLLGISDLSEEEQAAFLSEVGDVIFETSLVRLVSGLSEEKQEALEAYLDTNPEPEILLSHLIEHYKDFPSILEDVVVEFKEDALKVLGDRNDDIQVVD